MRKFKKNEGVLYAGKAQEKARIMKISPVDYERRHEQQAVDPGAHHVAAALGSVKMRPGNAAETIDVGTTADLDRAPARVRRAKRVGRDEGTGSAGGTNKGTGRNKKGSHHMT